MKKMKTLLQIKKILQNHKPYLKDKYNVIEIGVFGSYAKSGQKKGSDIDILVEFKEVPDLLTFIELERHLKKLLGAKIDLVRKHSLREELKESILREVEIV